MSDDKRRRIWALVAHAPILLVMWTNALFVWNHFYVHAPYLHDSGWFSATVYRAGLMPKNPVTTGHSVIYYWGWHPSFLVSAGSLLSYLFPGERVDWYCIFQALIYAPLAFAVPLLVPKEERTSILSALFVAACSTAFAFNGEVLSNMGYPHFEIFSPAGIAIMLAALASGRERLAWVGLAMSVATREDGGYHAASFLAAVLACDLLKRPFPIARRKVIVMMAVAFASTVLLVIAQKTMFVSVNAWEIYLVGKPPFAHLNAHVLAERFAYFGTRCAFLWLPALAAAIIAIARRDARYLLGWVVTIPWFVLNITAKQELKAQFSVYIGFPFIASLFWVGAYARVTGVAWRRTLGFVAVTSVASSLALYGAFPSAVESLARDGFAPGQTNPAGVRAFANALREGRYGDVRMTVSVAAWALEGIDATKLVPPQYAHSLKDGDAFAFHRRDGAWGSLIDSPFKKCGHVPRAGLYLCVRDDAALPSELAAGSPFLDTLELNGGAVRRDDGGITVAPGPIAVRTFGPYMKLPPGPYVVEWDVAFDHCLGDRPQPNMRIDVCRNASVVAAEKEISASNARAASLSFDVTPEMRSDVWEFRTFSGSCGFVLKDVLVQRRSEP